MTIEGKTSTPAYVTDYAEGSNVVSGVTPEGIDPAYRTVPLLTVGDEVPLLEGEFGNYTASETQTYAFAGIPDGIGYTEIDGIKYVFVNHELSADVTTDLSSTIAGQINGARVSLFLFDEDWNVIGGRNLIETVEADGTTYNLDLETGNYLDTDGNLLNEGAYEDGEFGNLSRFCSGYLAAKGFVDADGNEIPVYFAPEESGDFSRGWAVTPDGNAISAQPRHSAIALDGLGRYSKEQVYSASQYRAGNPSGKTVLLGMEDEGDGELYMYVGDQTAEDPNGFKDTEGTLYVLRLEDSEGKIYTYEDMPENVQLVAKWVAVPDDVTLNPDGSILTGWVNGLNDDGTSRATNFRRLEDLHEDPNSPGTFYLVTTGRVEKNGSLEEEAETPEEADNPYGKLHRLILNPDEPTGDATFEFLMSGGSDTGVSYDNIVVDTNGNVLIQEDSTAFGEDILNEQQRQGSVLSYNIEANEGVVGEDRVTFLFELDQNVEGSEFNTEFGAWETSGIVEIDPEAADGQSSYLFNVQAHTIDNDSGVYEGQYEEGGQLILTEPITTELQGFASLPADTFADGPPAGGDDGEGNPIEANGRTGPFDGQPIQGFSGVQFAPDGNGAFWFLSDNGFGSQENSSDYLLRLYQVDPNFAGTENGDGSIEIQGFVQLADPDNLIPFDIVNEDSEERLLTGADFDIESFVIDDKGDIWIGDEFGPYLLHFDATGKLLEAPIPTPNITNFQTLEGQDPLVIGHRGASGTLPEHTLEAYKLAIEQGADFIEPDLVVTKDGVLIARHEPTLAQVELDEEGNIKFNDNGEPILKAGTANTTNVFELPQFADRLTVKNLDGTPVGGWYAEDFTLEEIKQLTAIQSRDYRDQSFNDDGFKVPTFEEVIALAKENGVGIYPETKHPTYFWKEGTYLDGTPINVDTSQLLIDTLVANDFTDPERIFIQSFEIENLLRLQNEIMPEAGIDIPLVQLTDDVKTSVYDVAFNFRPGNPDANPDIYDDIPIGLRENTDYGDLLNTAFIDWIAENYAEGLGPWKETFRLTEALDEPVDGDGDGVAEITKEITGQVVPIVDWAHDAGLQVHTYTMRDEERHLYLVDGEPESAEEEYRQLIELGVDGFFTDFPATGVAVVDSLTNEFVFSPQNPDLGDDLPNLSRSRGFEGMAFSPDRTKAYPLLEGAVLGDPDDALRIYEFDLTQGGYTGLVGYYRTEIDGNAIGDFTPINDREFLIIERDNNQGEEAEFKKIYKIDINNINPDGYVEKELVVDLLNIQDPNDVNGDGSTTFDFPFQTIEDVVVVDENTILVANDNNYPFSMGREGDIDNNEVILLDLDKPLDLDPRLGGTVFTPQFLENGDTEQPAQMIGLNGYFVDPVFTIGETFPDGSQGDYTPPGILDGLGAFSLDENTVRILANHELSNDVGYEYSLANGTELPGARVSFFDIDIETREVVDVGLAYDTIINRNGEVVDEASDLEFEGLNRFCSSTYIEAHQFGEGRGFTDGIYFTGEETDGGTEFALDVANNTLYALPWLGRAAWENVTEIDTGTTDKVALLVGDDREAAPLLLYVGEKDTSESADFLSRNGLDNGKLYVWVPDEGADTPTFTDEDGEEVDPDDAPDPFGFNGTGNSQAGTWVELDYYRPDLAGSAVDTNGDGEIQDEMVYDDLGFATQAQQDQLFIDAGGFQFSRPEDVATNPEDGTEVVLASTGRGGRFAEDNWGTTYNIKVEFGEDGNPLTANLNILYDGDDAGNGQFESPDFGLRSPDNLDWADDGYIYINEDRATAEDEDFGGESGEEASIWRLDPNSGELTRVAQMDRDAVPEGQTDPEPDDIGNWESSGILDVSELFGEDPGNLFIFDVQAHSLTDGIIGGDEYLVQGGQLAFLEQEESEELTEVFGTSTNDILEAGLTDGFSTSNNLVFAGEGDDLLDLSQSEGNNRVFGDGGNDIFLLGVSDRLSGGDDSDSFFTLTGGNNVVTGGEGADRFWIANAAFPESANTITDFEFGIDVIGISGLGVSFEDLSITQEGDNTLLGANDKKIAIFLDLDAASLSADNFAFA